MRAAKRKTGGVMASDERNEPEVVYAVRPTEALDTSECASHTFTCKTGNYSE